jgi:hypothetical protein
MLQDLLRRKELGGKRLPEGKEFAELLVDVIAKHALSGDYRYIRLLYENDEDSQEIQAIWQELESLAGDRGGLASNRSSASNDGAG